MKNLLLPFLLLLLFSSTSFLTAQNVGIGSVSPKEQLHNFGAYYGLGDIRLHAFEGDGNSGTAYLQARDDSGSSSIGLQFRTQFFGNVEDAMHFLPNGNAGINVSAAANVGLQVRGANHSIIFSLRSVSDEIRLLVRGGGSVTFNGHPFFTALNVRNPSASNPFIFNAETANGTNRFNVNDNGGVGIGSLIPKQQLHNTGDYYGKGHFWLHAFEGDGNSGTAYLQARDDSGFSSINLQLRTQLSGNIVDVLRMDVNGNIYAPHISYGDYSNMQYRTSDGRFFYDNSSRRYKENIQPLQDNFSLILKAQPKTYTRPPDGYRDDRLEVGYIAEEMDSLGLTKLVSYDAAGIPDGFNYEKMILYVNEILKMQQANLETKELEIARLKQRKKQIQAQWQQQQQSIEALQAAVIGGSANNGSTDLPDGK